MIDRGQVLEALGTVRDPELDESVTVLGFVSSCTVTDDEVDVRLRLPTYFCAPNFAYLMVADAFDAVNRVDGVRRTTVVLEDHFASDAINGGVAARAGFVASFDGEAVDELESLRRDFLRKAVLAGTDLVCRPLVAAGRTPEELAVHDARRRRALPRGRPAAVPPPGPRPARRRRRRRCWSTWSPASAVGVDALPLHLRKARVTGVSVGANSSICRGLLQERYGAGSRLASVGGGAEEEL